MGIFIDKHHKFIAELSSWYQTNKRDLPWRETQDPYKIWLSEIILQQTRVAQGLKYYLKFVEHYPSVHELAKAKEQEVLKDWQGLGYYSRARNLHKAAQYISFELNGNFPNSYELIKGLSGVGDYTAAAIASFAFNLPHAVVDGNVYRTLSRIFGIHTPMDTSQGKNAFQQLADLLLDKKSPSIHNQAMMEFGALQCVPKRPDCATCPMSSFCVAHLTKTVADLPIKKNKLKQKTVYLNYLLFESADQIAVNLRRGKGIWQNLYDFPLIQSSSILTFESLKNNANYKSFDPKKHFRFQAESTVIKHILSHQILQAKFYHFRGTDFSYLTQNFDIIDKKKLAQLPIPKLIENYLKQETNLLSLFHP